MVSFVIDTIIFDDCVFHFLGMYKTSTSRTKLGGGEEINSQTIHIKWSTPGAANLGLMGSTGLSSQSPLMQEVSSSTSEKGG